jgi:hypothetical protein
MFIKRTKVNNITYIQITKSFRDGNRIRHKVVLNLGRADKISIKEIDGLINVLLELKAGYPDERDGL